MKGCQTTMSQHQTKTLFIPFPTLTHPTHHLHSQDGEVFEPSSLTFESGSTAPPSAMTEVELITEMDKFGIGTDATIAQHIKTIQDREYVTKDASAHFHPTNLGIALVEGYNSMGYQLNKPHLERGCNEVAEGRKTGVSLIEETMDKMKLCFQVVLNEAHKLDAAMAKHFDAAGADHVVKRADYSYCGCGNLMDLKEARAADGFNNNNQRSSQLLYCSTCEDSHPLPRKGVLSPMNEQICPICEFQVIKVSTGEDYDGKGYTFCHKCFNNPPTEHGGDIENGGEFRCFSCSHPSCKHAGKLPGSDVEIVKCPRCEKRGVDGSLNLGKASTGSFKLSCSNWKGDNKCDYCIWLPRAAKAITVASENKSCKCYGGTRKIKFEWKSGTSIPPQMRHIQEFCVFCDDELEEYMGLKIPPFGGAQNGGGGGRRVPNGGSGRGASAPGRGRGDAQAARGVSLLTFISNNKFATFSNPFLLLSLSLFNHSRGAPKASLALFAGAMGIWPTGAQTKVIENYLTWK